MKRATDGRLLAVLLLFLGLVASAGALPRGKGKLPSGRRAPRSRRLAMKQEEAQQPAWSQAVAARQDRSSSSSSSSSLVSLDVDSIRGIEPTSPAMRLKGGQNFQEASVDCFGKPIIPLSPTIPKNDAAPRFNEGDVYVAITYPGPPRGSKQYDSVSVVGAWDNWTLQIPLRPSTIYNDMSWSAVFRVPPGRYEFKFIRDGKWSLATNWHVVNDRVGTGGNHVLEVEGKGVRYDVGQSGDAGVQTALLPGGASGGAFSGWGGVGDKQLEERLDACQKEYHRALAEFRALSSRVDEITINHPPPQPPASPRHDPPQHAPNPSSAFEPAIGKAHHDSKRLFTSTATLQWDAQRIYASAVAVCRVAVQGLVVALLSIGGILWVVGAAGVFKAITFGIGKTSKMSRYNMPPMKSRA